MTAPTAGRIPAPGGRPAAEPRPGPGAPAAVSWRTATVIFVALKLSLMRNGLRQSTGRSAAFVGSVVVTLLVGGFGLLALVLLRGNEHAADVGILLVAVIALAWTFVPLFVGGLDETLDPGRLVMLPLRPRRLVVAQLVAALVGTGPLFTLLLLVGVVLAVAEGVAGAVAGVLAVLLVLVVCPTLTRAVATANTRLLTSRRGRDLAIFSGVVIAFGIQGVNVAASRLNDEGVGPLETAADVLRWVPPASAVDAVRAAGDGSYPVAAAGLAGTAALLALLLWWWQRALTHLMTSPDASTLQEPPDERRERTGGSGGLASLLPADRTGTAVLRTLRYGWRDPKTKLGWVMALGMGLLLPVVYAAQGTSSVYNACWAAGLLGLLMYNQFGQDYSAFWLVAQTITSTRDAFVELRARALAVGLIAAPYTATVVLLSAAALGDWAALPDAMGLALAVLGALFGVGAVTSARFPYSIPQDNPMKNVAAGQGSVAWFSILLGTLAGAVVCAPAIALTIWLNVADSGLVWLVLPVGLGYGTLAAYLGLRLGAVLTVRRLPEILVAVSRS